MSGGEAAGGLLTVRGMVRDRRHWTYVVVVATPRRAQELGVLGREACAGGVASGGRRADGSGELGGWGGDARHGADR